MKKNLKFLGSSVMILLVLSVPQVVQGMEYNPQKPDKLHGLLYKECTYAEQEKIVTAIAGQYVSEKLELTESLRSACSNYLKYGRLDGYDPITDGYQIAPTASTNEYLKAVALCMNYLWNLKPINQ